MSSVTLLLPVGICLLRLALGFFMPAAQRDLNTWHLWSMFALLYLGFAAVLSLLATLLSWAAVRLIKTRAA